MNCHRIAALNTLSTENKAIQNIAFRAIQHEEGQREFFGLGKKRENVRDGLFALAFNNNSKGNGLADIGLSISVFHSKGNLGDHHGAVSEVQHKQLIASFVVLKQQKNSLIGSQNLLIHAESLLRLAKTLQAPQKEGETA